MKLSRHPSEQLSPQQEQILRNHWEWAGGYALLWIVVTVLIFGAIYFLLDYSDVNESVRTQALVLLAAISLINAIWRAAGVVVARIDLILAKQRDDKSP